MKKKKTLLNSVDVEKKFVRFDFRTAQETCDKLTEAEVALKLCRRNAKCSFAKKLEEVYHVIPKKLVQTQDFLRRNKELEVLWRDPAIMQLLCGKAYIFAFPHKEDFIFNPQLHKRILETADSPPAELGFKPEILQFGPRPILQVFQIYFSIWNYGNNEAIKIMGIIFDGPQQISLLSKITFPIVINPKQGIKIELSTNLLSIGEINSVAYVNVNSQEVHVYRITGFGVPNNYGIWPVIQNSENKSENITLTLRPQNQNSDIQIQSIKPVGNSQLEWSRNNQSSITIQYANAEPSKRREYVELQLSNNKTLNVPIYLIFYNNTYTKIADFGMVPLNAKPLLIKFSIPIKDNDQVYFTPKENFFLSLSQNAKSGYISFSPIRLGIFEGMALIYSSSQETFLLQYRAQVVTQPPFYFEKGIKSLPTTQTLLFYSRLQYPEILLQSGPNKNTLQCPSPLSCYYSEGQFKKNFTMEVTQEAGRENADVSILGAKNLYTVPIPIYYDDFFCTYQEQNSSEKTIRKCNEIEEMHFGSFSTTSKAVIVDFNITYRGKFRKKINELSYLYSDSACFLSEIWVSKKSNPDFLHKYSFDPKKGFFSSDGIILNEDLIFSVKLNLSSLSNNSPRVRTPEDHSIIRSEIKVMFGGNVQVLILSYQFVEGELIVSPQKISFDGAILGTESMQPLILKNTHNHDLNVKKIEIKSPFLRFEGNLTSIPKRQSKMIGKIVLDTTNEKNSEQGDIYDGFTFYDFERYQKYHKKINHLGKNIESLLILHTDLLQQIEIPLNYSLQQPILFSQNDNEFPMTLRSGKSFLYLNISNPSATPLEVSFSITDFDIQRLKDVDMNHYEYFMQFRCQSSVNDICCRVARKMHYQISPENKEFRKLCESLRFPSMNPMDHFIANSEVFIIPPGGVRRIEAVTYYPLDLGQHYGVLIVKNNLTIASQMKIRGSCTEGGLRLIDPFSPVETQPLHFDIVKIPSAANTIYEGTGFFNQIFKILGGGKKQDTHHTKQFIVKNIGGVAMNVTSISLADYNSCTAFGISLGLCSPFIIEPSKEISFPVSYQISGLRKAFIVPIVFTLVNGSTISFSIKVNVDPIFLNLNLIDSSWTEYFYIILSIIVLCSTSVALILTLIMGISEIVRQKRKNSPFENAKKEDTKMERAQLMKDIVSLISARVDLLKKPLEKVNKKEEEFNDFPQFSEEQEKAVKYMPKPKEIVKEEVPEQKIEEQFPVTQEDNGGKYPKSIGENMIVQEDSFIFEKNVENAAGAEGSQLERTEEYSCFQKYQPFSKMELKFESPVESDSDLSISMPGPLIASDTEIMEDEVEPEEEKEKDQRILEAFCTANSLFGPLVTSKPSEEESSQAPEVSPLSELREESTLYYAPIVRRPPGLENYRPAGH